MAEESKLYLGEIFYHEGRLRIVVGVFESEEKAISETRRSMEVVGKKLGTIIQDRCSWGIMEVIPGVNIFMDIDNPEYVLNDWICDAVGRLL